jgi:tetratricopeptide (TPR) repeat protein
VAAAGLLWSGWTLWAWLAAPGPPPVSFADVDPAVAEAVETARRDAWWSPHSAAAWGRLGQVLRAHGFRAESNACLARAERLDPNDPRWPYLQGHSLQLEDAEAALRHLQRAVGLCGQGPDGPELCLAEVCLQLGRLDEAEWHFRHVLQQEPANARARLGLGRLAVERGNWGEALDHLNRSAANRLTQRASAVLLAGVHHQLGDQIAADREQSRAAELPADPPWPDPFLEEVQALMVGKQARLARVKTLHRQGRLAEARDVARRLEDDYPDVYWLVEGREQMHKGNLPAAEQALRRSAELAPDSVDAHFDLGTVLFRQGQYRAAVDAFRKVTELEPGYGPAYLSLGPCWLKLGDRAEAIRAFRAAVRCMPQNAEAHRELGAVLLQEGRPAEAAAPLRQVLQLSPGDARARELLEEVSRR